VGLNLSQEVSFIVVKHERASSFEAALSRDSHCRLRLIVVLLEKLLILLDRFLLKVFLFLPLKLLIQDLCCRDPCDLKELPGLQPAVSQLEFVPD